MTNTQPNQENVELRLRNLLTVWMALLMSIGLYFGITLVVRSSDIEPNPTLSLTLVGIGILTVLTAFLIKNRLVSRAVEKRQVRMVQHGYIVSWAVNEVAAMLGLLDHLLTANRYYYLLFIVAAVGMLLLLPRREPVENAAFKSGTF